VEKLGSVVYQVAHEIGEQINLEVRCTVLGHTQLGGTPLAFDRVLGTPGDVRVKSRSRSKIRKHGGVEES
jgi:6-phosphofructokinase